MAQGGDFLIATQSDLANSIGLYCDPISHSYCWKNKKKHKQYVKLIQLYLLLVFKTNLS
jgi:hypothetical protein